jgi:chromosome segregation ATPase
VRIELRQGQNRPLLYELAEADFLIGSVAGCDLRLPGSDLPPVIALVARRSEGVAFRRLVHSLPIFLNGRNQSAAFLNDGDRVTIGPTELWFRIEAPTARGPTPASLDARARELDERQRLLHEGTVELETDRVIWYRRREEMEQESRQLQELQHNLEARTDELVQSRRAIDDERSTLANYRRELDDQDALRQQDVENRLGKLRQDQEALEKKRAQYEAQLVRLDRWEADLESRQRDLDERVATLDRQAVDLRNQARSMEERCESLVRTEAELQARANERAVEEERLQAVRRELEDQQAEVAKRQAGCQAWEDQLSEDRLVLQRRSVELQSEHERLQERARALDERQHQFESTYERLQTDSADFEQQAHDLEAWQKKLQAEAEQLETDRAQVEPKSQELAQRAADVEAQQIAVTALRARLERIRADLAQEQERISQEEERIRATDEDQTQRAARLEQLRAELEQNDGRREAQKTRLEERCRLMETALGEMRQLKDRLDSDQAAFERRASELAAQAASGEQAARDLDVRASRLAAAEEELEAQRRSLTERQAQLTEAETSRVDLQDKLRRRSEQLAEQLRALAERDSRLAVVTADIDSRQTELDSQRAHVESIQGQLAERDALLTRQVEHLKDVARIIAAQRKRFFIERKELLADQKAAASEQTRRREEFTALRDQALELQRLLPELEVPAEEALAHFAQVRDQLREHLQQLHVYARQSQDDLETLRTRLTAEADQNRQQSLTLARARQDHAVAVAAFRQQLIDWQGQVAQMRRALRHDESRIEKREAEVAAVSARLALQEESLDKQERDVDERRSEVERHLEDMREWYRSKLRELSRLEPAASPQAQASVDPAIPDDTEPLDRQLGELLHSLGLVDSETLISLLNQARDQRRTLRQVLLANGFLTLYQLALIEAGNLDGLVLGPVRIMDRLRVTPRETVYRVFDPRRASGPGDGYVVLRLLAESEVAARGEEFRRSFRLAAALQHPGLVATHEVIDIKGRPAAIQELVSALPAPEWPPFAAHPSCWLALVKQAATAMQAAQVANVTHGHMTAAHFLLTGDGNLKIAGFGEPFWLAGPEALEAAPEAPDDFAVFAKIALSWRDSKRKRKRVDARLEPLLARLEVSADAFANVAELLEALAHAGAESVPCDAAWTRLVDFVRDRITPPPLRQSA